MTTEATTKKITITMSESRPLKVDPAAWPVIAKASWHDGQIECQANYVRSIKVREHRDGRRIVYGIYVSGPGGGWQGFRGMRGGFIVDSVRDENRDPRETAEGASWVFPDEEETIRAIRRVAGIIGDDSMGDECIANLPAEELA
jgi:hypothetical protein